MTDQTTTAPMGGVIPYLNVDGATAAVDFYKQAFGAIEHARLPADDGKRLMHCHLEINGGGLMVSDVFPEHGHPFTPSTCFTCQLVVGDGQAWWDRAVAAGAKVITPYEVMFWGDTWGQLEDPWGVRWAINCPAKR